MIFYSKNDKTGVFSNVENIVSVTLKYRFDFFIVILKHEKCFYCPKKKYDRSL